VADGLIWRTVTWSWFRLWTGNTAPGGRTEADQPGKGCRKPCFSLDHWRLPWIESDHFAGALEGRRGLTEALGSNADARPTALQSLKSQAQPLLYSLFISPNMCSYLKNTNSPIPPRKTLLIRLIMVVGEKGREQNAHILPPTPSFLWALWVGFAFSQASTNQARPCLASEISRDWARLEWYSHTQVLLSQKPKGPHIGDDLDFLSPIVGSQSLLYGGIWQLRVH
jgi:hypothetical protein